MLKEVFVPSFALSLLSQSYIKNDITAVHWRSITSGETVATS